MGAHLARRETSDRRGRVRVYLGKGHPYANSGGWQWRSRLVVMEALGRALRSDEHVHHLNGVRDDDRLENLEVVAAEYHGRYHAICTTLAGGRNSDGRFRELREPGPTFWAPRLGPVIGHAALEAAQ